MKVKNAITGEATITLSTSELRFLRHAVLETLEALGEEEFETRTGETIGRARQIMVELKDVLQKTRA
jgi:hypothetical protein